MSSRCTVKYKIFNKIYNHNILSCDILYKACADCSFVLNAQTEILREKGMSQRKFENSEGISINALKSYISN